MSLKSRVLLFFPTLVMAGFLTVLGLGFWRQDIYFILGAILFIYLFPLICFRIHRIWHGPLREIYQITDSEYNSWWGGHQIQLIFIAFPFFETVLRIIPGLFSIWLRMWGSQIGKNIYWTPYVDVIDRDMIEVGDNVIFGHMVKIVSHVVTPRKNKLTLFVRPVKIETASFIGAGSVLGPGTRVSEGANIPAGSQYFNGQTLQNQNEVTK